VYTTAFTLANNATPAMYSFWPWLNRDMLLVWFYLLFIAFSQTFVLVSLTVIQPPAVDSQHVFVDCVAPVARQALVGETAGTTGAPSAAETLGAVPLGSGGPGGDCSSSAGVDSNGLSEPAQAYCQQLDVVFEADLGGRRVQYRTLEREVLFYHSMFGARNGYIYMLQFVCCVWVTVQVYFVDFKNVAALLQFRDFNRWLLPLKGEEPRRNAWVMIIPLLQYLLGVGVVAVSCCVTCGSLRAFDIVLNSLAFTFISQVAELFNEPLLRYYSAKAIEGLDASWPRPDLLSGDRIFRLEYFPRWHLGQQLVHQGRPAACWAIDRLQVPARTR